jgi:hypothetical protein
VSDYLLSEDQDFGLCSSFVIGDSHKITDAQIDKTINEINSVSAQQTA